MPNGKAMKDCTGAEMAKFGNRYQRIAEKAYRKHREWFEISVEMAICAVREALNGTGARTVPAPHRSSHLGARAMLRPTINEMAIALDA